MYMQHNNTNKKTGYYRAISSDNGQATIKNDNKKNRDLASAPDGEIKTLFVSEKLTYIF